MKALFFYYKKSFQLAPIARRRSSRSRIINTMSLPRASYLESWEYGPLSQQRQRSLSTTERDCEDSTDNANQELPESLVSSSFPSTYSQRQRLSFNPYSGPGWTQGSFSGEDDGQHLAAGRDTEDAISPTRVSDLPHMPLKQPKHDAPLTQGAFEVPVQQRIGKFHCQCASA